MFTKVTTDYASMTKAELSKILSLNSVVVTAGANRDELVALAISNSINPDGTKGAIGNPTADIIFASKGKKHDIVVRVGDSVDSTNGTLVKVTKDMLTEDFFVASQCPDGKDSRYFYAVYIHDEELDHVQNDALVLLHESKSKYDKLDGYSYSYIFGYKGINKSVSLYGLDDVAAGAGVKLAYMNFTNPLGLKGFVFPNYTVKQLVLTEGVQGKNREAYTYYKDDTSLEIGVSARIHTILVSKAEREAFLPSTVLMPDKVKVADLSEILNLAIYIASEARAAGFVPSEDTLRAYISRVEGAIAKGHAGSVSREVLGQTKGVLLSMLGSAGGDDAPDLGLGRRTRTRTT